MKYRKNIDINNATEEELLRYQMENIVKTSVNEIENLGECSESLTKIYKSLKYRHTRSLFGFMINIYLIVGVFIFVIKFFRRK